MIPPSKKQRTDGDAAGVALDAGAEAAAVAGDASGDAMMAEAVLTPKAAGGGVVSKAAARVTPSSKAAGDASAVRRDANAPELEEDHPEDDKREQISEPVGFNVPDTTLNAMVGATGGMVMSINEGGLSYLLAGARANVGIRSGRYAFEARIVEMTNQAEPPGQQQRSSLPRNLLRIGFSVAGSMPLMGDTEESVCFDSEGSFHHNKKRSHVSQKFGADVVVTVVLNMRETGPNAMTVSLFKDGVRVAAPQPIPEVLRGKTLYPTVTFKNVSVQVNWGPRPFAPLPFRCRMLQDAALEDVEVLRPREPEDGKFNILFPVCLPDNGTFHWCDWFLSQNPHYTEISDRRIIDWAVRSGIWRPRSPQARLCNDRPDLNLGLPSLEDGSAKRTLITAAATQRRDIVIMEVRGNLMKTDRMLALRPFKMPHFRRLAWVMAGQPMGDYRDHCLQVKLKEKQEKANAEFASKKADRDRKRYLEMQKRKVEKAKRKMERARLKAMEEQRKAEEAKAEEAKEGEGKVEGDVKDEEMKEGDAKPLGADAKLAAEQKEESEDEDEPMPEEDEPEPPKVELTETERYQCFRKNEGEVPDISTAAMMAGAGNGWSYPGNDEGFDSIEYPWQDLEGCEYAMRQWKNERKLATKVEYIAPSDWFKEKWKNWQSDLQRWHVKHMEFKDPVKRQARKEALQLEKLQKQQAALLEQQAKNENPAEAKAETAAGDENAADNNHSNEAAKTENGGEKNDGTKKEENSEEMASNKDVKVEEPAEQRDPMLELEEQLAQREKFDVFGIEEILDSNGEGEPLFSNFAFEDWALLSLRFELHLVVHAFRRDCKDPDRTGFPPEHLPYYYNKYFKRSLSPKNYGATTIDELIELVKDTLVVCDKTLESQITDDLETNEVFMKLTEEERRDRHRRIEAGDPKAPLRFSRAPPTDMVLAQAQLKAPPPNGPRGAMPNMLGGMGAVPKGAGTAPSFDMGMSKAAGMDLAMPMPSMPQAMDGMGMPMDPNMNYDNSMGWGMDPSGGMSGVTAPSGMDYSAMGEWAASGDSSAGGGGDWDMSGDWGGMGKGDMDFDSFMGKMMEKGIFDKGKGKGKTKMGKMAAMAAKGGKKGGGGWYGGPDKGSWGKGPSKGSLGCKGKGVPAAWKGGWK